MVGDRMPAPVRTPSAGETATVTYQVQVEKRRRSGATPRSANPAPTRRPQASTTAVPAAATPSAPTSTPATSASAPPRPTSSPRTPPNPSPGGSAQPPTATGLSPVPTTPPDPRDDPASHIASATGTGAWTQYEVTAQIPADASLVRFGVFLNGGGQLEFRHPELAPHPPGQQ